MAYAFNDDKSKLDFITVEFTLQNVSAESWKVDSLVRVFDSSHLADDYILIGLEYARGDSGFTPPRFTYGSLNQLECYCIKSSGSNYITIGAYNSRNTAVDIQVRARFMRV